MLITLAVDAPPPKKKKCYIDSYQMNGLEIGNLVQKFVCGKFQLSSLNRT